jgi:hypothetical protein
VRGQSHFSHYVKTWAAQEFDNDFQDNIGPVLAAVDVAASWHPQIHNNQNTWVSMTPKPAYSLGLIASL